MAPVGPLGPGATAEVDLSVAVFRPGVYVLDDYVVDWEVPAGSFRPAERGLRGSRMGEPFVLRVEAAGDSSGGSGGGGGGGDGRGPAAATPS